MLDTEMALPVAVKKVVAAVVVVTVLNRLAADRAAAVVDVAPVAVVLSEVDAVVVSFVLMYCTRGRGQRGSDSFYERTSSLLRGRLRRKEVCALRTK